MKLPSLVLAICLLPCAPGLMVARAEMVVTDLGKKYDFDPSTSRPGLFYDIQNKDVCAGNTSLRNEPANSLAWKGKPTANGHGYFQRNRDLGQVFNVPEGEDVKLDALVLRTARGRTRLSQARRRTNHAAVL